LNDPKTDLIASAIFLKSAGNKNIQTVNGEAEAGLN
jgi:hypothetical protein